MTSRKRQHSVEKDKRKTDYDALHSPKDFGEESVDDMLANVDQFIQGVYRDLSITPPQSSSAPNRSIFHTARSSNDDTSISSASTSPDGASSSSGTLYGGEIASPTTRRNLDAEIERINRICDNVNQNLQSIGLFMNHSNNKSTTENLLNLNLTTSPSSSTSSLMTLTLNSPPLSKIVVNLNAQNSERRRPPPMSSVVAAVIDLSESQTQTPEFQPQQIEQNNDHDDDVILVSSNIQPVVDLCTPSGHQEAPRRRTSTNYRELNRRRLSHEDVVDNGETCCEGRPSTSRRRTNHFTLPKSDFDTKKTTNSNQNSSSTTAASDRTPNMCPVCMESYLQHLPTSTRCGHVFCKKCIEHAIRLTRKCPMCNTKISNSQIFRIYL